MQDQHFGVCAKPCRTVSIHGPINTSSAPGGGTTANMPPVYFQTPLEAGLFQGVEARCCLCWSQGFSSPGLVRRLNLNRQGEKRLGERLCVDCWFPWRKDYRRAVFKDGRVEHLVCNVPLTLAGWRSWHRQTIAWPLVS